MQKNKSTQRDIWLANLNLGKKGELGTVRPVLVIQNQYLLDAQHSTIIVIPLTTQLIDDVEPLRIRINALKTVGDVIFVLIFYCSQTA